MSDGFEALLARSSFGDVSQPFNLTRDQVIDYLLDQICPAGEPWTGDDPTSDHGHTHCLFLGTAVRMLRKT